MVRLLLGWGVMSRVLSAVLLGSGKLLWGEATSAVGRFAQGAVAVGPWGIVAGILGKRKIDSTAETTRNRFVSLMRRDKDDD